MFQLQSAVESGICSEIQSVMIVKQLNLAETVKYRVQHMRFQLEVTVEQAVEPGADRPVTGTMPSWMLYTVADDLTHAKAIAKILRNVVVGQGKKKPCPGNPSSWMVFFGSSQKAALAAWLAERGQEETVRLSCWSSASLPPGLVHVNPKP